LGTALNSISTANRNRPCDMSDLEIVGERLKDVGCKHEHDFPSSRSEAGDMPVPLARDGIEGVFYRKYDLTLCTYCSRLNGLILTEFEESFFRAFPERP